ncbi:MAG: hypothetical protein Q8919_03750 [Bacteroidota bacterium]|nr:hypothetical protein [Bacteroidota bacterium]
MRLLLNLVTALDENEIAKLAALNLRGKQLAVMELVLSKRPTGDEPTPEEVSALQLSDSHLYEISSVVLSKCHHILVPEGGLKLLEFLTYKNLILQFKQELRRQRKHIATKKGKQAEEFYLTGFELLNRFTYNLVDHDLLEEYGKLYLAAKADATAEDALAIKARKLQIKQAGILSDGKNFTLEQKELFAELTEIERTARLSNHAYLCYATYSALAWHWQHLGGSPEKGLSYLQLSLPYAAKLQGFPFRDAALEMKLRLADAHAALGEADLACEIFEKTYASIRRDHPLWKRNYFLFRYLAILIYVDKYAKAEKILTEHFEPLFKLRPTTASATAASLFAILFLLTGDFPNAKKYLDLGLQLNTKSNFTLYNEVRNRYIEAAYYYLIGDWDYTLELSHRAMQYLRGKHLGLNKHIFGYNFKIIEASIKYYSKDIPFWHKLEEKFKVLTAPAEGLFGKLLELIRDTPRRKPKPKPQV